MFKLGTNIPIHHLVRYLKTYLSFLRHYQVGPKKVLRISPWWQTLPCHCTREGRWVHARRCSRQSSCSPSTGSACHRREIVGEHFWSRPKGELANNRWLSLSPRQINKQTNRNFDPIIELCQATENEFNKNPIKINLRNHCGVIGRS